MNLLNESLLFLKLAEEVKIADLRKWLKEKWVDISRKDKDGKHPPCGRSDSSKGGYPKCTPAAKAKRMSKKDKKSATNRKRRAEKKNKSKTPKFVKTDASNLNLSKTANDYLNQVNEIISFFSGDSKEISNKPLNIKISQHNLQKLNELKSPFKEQATKLIEIAMKEGLNPFISEAFRSQERQNKLFEDSQKGTAVTWTKDSLHTQGLALDIYPIENGKVNYNTTDVNFYRKLGEIADSLNILWGGSDRWKGKSKDKPHFQFDFKRNK